MDATGVTIAALSVGSAAAISPFVAMELGKRDIGWTTIETGDIKFIMHGKSLHRIIYDTPGFELNASNIFIPTTRTLQHPPLGLYGLGIPGIAHVHRFKITKERENPQAKTKEDWILKGGEHEVDSLRFTFPRPYFFPKVELGDKQPFAFDVFLVAKFEVVDPIKLIFQFKGAFFENAGGLLKTAVEDRLNDFTLQEFERADKSEVGGILSHLKAPASKPGEDLNFNRALIDQVGLRLVGIAMSYDPATQATRDAMEAEAVAIAQGNARRATADAELYERQQRALGRKAHIAATIEALEDKELAAKILAREATPNVTTLVEGNSDTKPVVPVGGNKP